jgi:hypothetical protein
MGDTTLFGSNALVGSLTGIICGCTLYHGFIFLSSKLDNAGIFYSYSKIPELIISKI